MARLKRRSGMWSGSTRASRQAAPLHMPVGWSTVVSGRGLRERHEETGGPAMQMAMRTGNRGFASVRDRMLRTLRAEGREREAEGRTHRLG